MSNDQWEILEQVSGALQAQLLKGLLEAQGIRVVLSQEGIGESIYPVTLGPLSEIELLVPAAQLEEAQKILADFHAGLFEDQFYPNSSDESSETSPSDQG